MKFDWRRFTTYGEFTTFASSIPTGWTLHSWQDVGGNLGIDIRAIFTYSRLAGTVGGITESVKLPEVPR